jgi:hypothetical protein
MNTAMVIISLGIVLSVHACKEKETEGSRMQKLVYPSLADPHSNGSQRWFAEYDLITKQQELIDALEKKVTEQAKEIAALKAQRPATPPTSVNE